MTKCELIKCLKVINKQCAATLFDGEETTLILDYKVDDFMSVINNAISYLEKNKPDYRDC